MQVNFSLTLPVDHQYVAVVRHLAESTLTELRVARECVDDIALALTEACANVISHGDPSDGFDVELAVDGDVCRISIREKGGAFDADALGGADDLMDAVEGADHLTHGRGVPLMRMLVDDLSYQPDATGTTVVLTKQLELGPESLLTL